MQTRRMRDSILLRRTVFACVGLLGLVNVWGMRPYVVPPKLTANDFTADYVSAREWFEGGDPYGPLPGLILEHLGDDTPYFESSPGYQRNAHPPILIVLLSPLALLPFRVARGLLLVSMAAAFVYAAAWLARRMGWPRAAAALVALGVLAVPVVQADLLFAQINGVILALLLWAWRSLERGRDRTAGVALGVAAAIKFFPAFMIIGLARGKRWRAATWQVTTAVVLSAIGVLAIGFDESRGFASGDNAAYWGPAPHNRSLIAVPGRWLDENFWFGNARRLGAIAGVLAALTLIACVLAAYRTPARVTGDRFWSVVPLMLLAAPLSWDHYAVILIPLALLVAPRLAGLGRGWAWIAGSALGVALLGNVTASTVIDATGIDDVSVVAQLAAWSIPLYALVAFAVADRRARARPIARSGTQ